MPLDPSIILGAKQPQFDLSRFERPEFSPMNAMAAAAKFKQADQENALNAQKLAEYERARTEEQDFRSYLATTEDLNAPENRQNFLRYGKTGAAFGEALGKQQTEKLTQQKTQFDIEKTKREFTAQAFRDTSRNPSDANITAYKEDYLANPLFSKAEKDRMVAGVDRLLALPVGERATFMASQGAPASAIDLRPTVVGSSSSVYDPVSKTFIQAPAAPATPAAPPASVAEFERARTDPAFMKFLQDRAAATRAPAQPVAPTITQIVDPTNPNKMITIDARRYNGGTLGSPGVIGVAGKEPGAALRENKVEAGKTQLADDLANLRASFEALDKMRAIPSTERNVASNIASGVAATGLGQRAGQLFGTEAQVERDVISSARMRLVNSIKNATGMSAQQLNSNVELQTMLKSISDPGQSVQAALRIIGDIEDAYVKGDGKMPKRGAAGAAPAAAGALSPAEQAELDQLRKRFGGK
jgi:hypothetical protein